MNRHALVLAAALAAAPLGAQQTAPAPAAPAPAPKIVAVINGEVITQEKLDSLWARLGARMRKQYEATGGKQGYLENYLRKRLMVQEALKSGFDKRPDVQADLEAAKESALFDRYVRDVVSREYVNDETTRKYYEEHKSEFVTGERIKVRHIVVTPQGITPEAARQKIERAYAELQQEQKSPSSSVMIFLSRFGQAAERYSDDPSAAKGGDLGWVERGLLDKTFEDIAFNLKVGEMSGIVETKFGYHLILLEDRTPPGTQTYEEAKADLREYLMTQNASKVLESVNRLTSELYLASKITVFPENIK